MLAPLIIDGSQGEGGGQVIRSSLALSLLTGRPFELQNVRAGRSKPGLLRQHLTAVRAAVEISQAQVTGDELGSSHLRFEPGPVVPGDYCFSVGSAGSATLVLQTILPPLLVAEARSHLTLEGGTHNPWAPPYDFLRLAYLPLVNRMGPTVTTNLEHAGFYPAGGGRFTVQIQPSPTLSGFDLLSRGELKARRGRALWANLPEQIADREKEHLKRLLNWNSSTLTTEQVPAHGPGNVVLLEVEFEQVCEVFAGFGARGVRAEQVVEGAVEEFHSYLKTDAPVGSYLADQLLLPLGVSAWQTGPGQRGGAFKTLALTPHSLTHLNILQAFLGIAVEIEPEESANVVVVRLGPPPKAPA